MVVAPKVKGFMCTTAHPEGCKAAVKAQIDYVKSQPKSEGPKKSSCDRCIYGIWTCKQNCIDIFM